MVKDQYKWIVIVFSSYLFYVFSGPRYVCIIFGITVITFFSSILIDSYLNIKKRKIFLICTIVACVGVLFFFKYFNFFSVITSKLIALFGIRYDPIMLNIILPVGISFYTFQAIGYVVDVYRGDVKSEKHFGKYAAFISFFPQLLAGPIGRSKQLIPQINQKHEFNYYQAMHGVKLMLWGYYKKLVIADFLQPYVQKVYVHPQEYQGFALVIATIFFSIQIYCDFSGYSDIAIGTAKLFGIDLIVNFKSPYFSKSIKEFWSRWHISLSTWFRDYIYIPLGGNRVGKIRHCLNLMVTFLVSGLWHGANLTYIVWGGIHGIAQVGEVLINRHNNESKRIIVKFLKIIFVFCFCSFAWVFFVSSSISDSLYVITNSFYGITSPISYLRNGFVDIGFSKTMLALTTILVFVLICFDYISLKIDFDTWISSKGKIVQWTFYLAIGCLIVFLSNKGLASEFIYFQY